MRALLIGLGGSGCRIVETLHNHDERSKVKSVRSYAFDSDPELIHSMKTLDVANRIVLSHSDPTKADYEGGDDFDLSGVCDCFQNDGFEDIDGFFVCAGLGGRMADLLPRFVEELETVFSDPVFTILTLPCKSEGVKVSTRAAEQLEAIRALGSASIIFDNETWTERIEADAASESKEIQTTPAAHRAPSELYGELNEMLARRVGLLLRAGEVTHNGVESAEVVLDAGEVLNTLTGMDIVSIGYATEMLPKNMTGMFKRLFVEKYMLDEGYQRTARIIDLAKKAVYEEVSVPCDLTSAEKALVLIAGPSEELSMKGFQMVRKWIDNSIRGIEMRAGDYPVKSTKYVGVIIVLAGIQNVPRIAELEEIRESYYQEMQKVYEGFEIQEEDIPLIAVASDDTIFEPGEVLPPGTYIPAIPESIEDASSTALSVETLWALESTKTDDEMTAAYSETDMTNKDYTDDDSLFDDVQTGNTAVYEEEEDLFEETPREIRRYTAPKPAPSSAFIPAEPKSDGISKNLGRISVSEPKRVSQIDTGSIALPKREKKEDMVLSGQASVGDKSKPKDHESGVRVGGTQRPKETDDVAIGKVQHPKDSDGPIKFGSTQRPKDNDNVRIAKVQRPKDVDRGVSAGSRQRPRDGDGAIRISRIPKPKDYSEQVKVSAKKKAKEEESHERSEFRWL